MEISELRDRIVGLERVKAKDLLPNPHNYRGHSDKQKEVFKSILGEVGIADVLLARKLDDGKRVLINGHMRKGQYPAEQEVPVVIVDLTEEEANMMLAFMDPLAGMATTDKKAHKKLIKKLKPGDEILNSFFSDLTPTRGGGKGKAPDLDVEPGSEGEEEVPAEAETGASHVRMVQLFFNIETQPVFNSMIESLHKVYNTFNITDCVVAAVKEAFDLRNKADADDPPRRKKSVKRSEGE